MLPKRLVLPATLAVLTLASACNQEPQVNPNDPCSVEYGPDCSSVESADGGPVYEPNDGGPECIC
jgi:hypothetical protein